ncbi:MAG: hydrogenase iron-sulfur subunit, partial [Gemmatimonadetes bacterium]|nr:hydrogenase iron-sulfur subunit [Gemmatimonadota bacterium]NIX47212.1 hydrogenase iron-sulfur subunit [Gemmatimonadota bacterium]
LHTSVIEYLVRAGAGGVMVVACPPRDCWNREGVTWLEERVYNEREAELKDRVDRR